MFNYAYFTKSRFNIKTTSLKSFLYSKKNPAEVIDKFFK